MNVRQDAQPAQSGKTFVLKPELPVDPLAEESMIRFRHICDRIYQLEYGYVDKNDPPTDDEVLENG